MRHSVLIVILLSLAVTLAGWAEPAAPAPAAFPLMGSFDPVKMTMLLTADLHAVEKADAVKLVRYVVRRDADQSTVSEGTFTTADAQHLFRKLIFLPKLDAGAYSIEATLVMKDGTAQGPVKSTFTKLDEAKAFPEWWNTKLGNVERVIKPFEAMTCTDNIVAVWGRAYLLGRLGLPTLTISQGETISGAPARLVVTVKGKETVIPLDGDPEFTEIKPWRVCFSGKAGGAGLLFTAHGRIEQDGLASIDLTYAPEGKAPVTIEKLRLEFPLSGEQAECLVCTGAGEGGAAKLLATTPGKLWDTLEGGRARSGMTVGSFYPGVWVGNEKRGFLWWADSDRGWVPDDNVPAHEVYRDGKQVMLRSNIIGSPFTLIAPRTVSFCYMASPFRPLVKGWRATPLESTRSQRIPPVQNPAEWTARWAETKQEVDAITPHELHDGPAILPKRGVEAVISLTPYGSDLSDKLLDPRIIGYLAPVWGGESWEKSEQDYYLYLMDRAIREGGVCSISWGNFSVKLNNNPQNSTAYILPDGRIQPGYITLNLRRLLMRMYALMSDHGLMPGAQVTRAGGRGDYSPVACPWIDGITRDIGFPDGERDWVEFNTVENMRTLTVAENWGTAIRTEPEIHYTPAFDTFKQTAQENLDYPRLFDCWGAYIPQPVWDWGMNDERTQYIPFWRNHVSISPDKDILVSMWRLPDRIMLEVFNDNREKIKDAQVKIDLAKLNLAPKLPWQEFIGICDLDKDFVKEKDAPASTLDVAGRTLLVPALKPHTGRLIGIRLY